MQGRESPSTHPAEFQPAEGGGRLERGMKLDLAGSENGVHVPPASFGAGSRVLVGIRSQTTTSPAANDAFFNSGTRIERRPSQEIPVPPPWEHQYQGADAEQGDGGFRDNGESHTKSPVILPEHSVNPNLQGIGADVV